MKHLLALCLAAAVFSSPPSRAEEGDTHLAVSGPLTLVDGSAFWGANGTILYEITPRWWLGGQTGFFYWHKSYVGASSTEWFVPLVPTVVYNLKPVSAGFHPYLGAGLGVAYVHNKFAPNAAPDITDSGIKFEGLLHAGARFGRQRHFFVDLGIGLVNDSFAFAPQAGWLFTL